MLLLTQLQENATSKFPEVTDCAYWDDVNIRVRPEKPFDGRMRQKRGTSLMSAVTLTFDQMERGADRTLALVYWVKHLENVAVCTFGLLALRFILRRFIRSLTVDRLDTLSAGQSSDIRKKLQQVHENLLSMLSRCSDCPVNKCNPVSRFALNGIEESAEDLSDIIEDLVLAGTPKFRDFIRDSVQSISRPAATVARM